MTRKYFGTDGVRGRVGETPITPDFVMKLGQAAGRVLRRRIDGRRHVRVCDRQRYACFWVHVGSRASSRVLKCRR